VGCKKGGIREKEIEGRREKTRWFLSSLSSLSYPFPPSSMLFV
jgi:hypothetical protein